MNLTAKCNLCILSDIERDAATTGASVVLRHGSYYVAEGAGIHVFVAPTGETPDTAERSDRTHGPHWKMWMGGLGTHCTCPADA